MPPTMCNINPFWRLFVKCAMSNYTIYAWVASLRTFFLVKATIFSYAI